MTTRELIEESGVAWQRAVEHLRAVRPATWLKIGACVAFVVGFAGAHALRGEVAPATAQRRAPHAVRARAAAHAGRPAAPTGADGRPIDPVEARKGNPHALNRLVAMTRADTCATRTEAAEALAGSRSPKAIAALRKLASSSFKDESDSPGIFSCSSRRAARKALEKQGG